MSRKHNKKNDPIKPRIKYKESSFDLVNEAEALNEFGQPPIPTDVVTPIKIFDMASDIRAQRFANDGGIALVQIPAHVNMAGKKRNKEAVLVYGPDRDHVMIFKAWIGAEAKHVRGNADTGANRWRLLVGGKIAKKALKYVNKYD